MPDPFAKRGTKIAARVTRYGRNAEKVQRAKLANITKTKTKRNHAKGLNTWAANAGKLSSSSTVNDTLFFYKWLFFGDMSREALKEKLESSGVLSDSNNNNNAKRFSNFFTVDSNDRVSLERVEEALKLQHENARYFPTPYRLIAALRNYALYGNDYLHWNDVLSQYHCVSGKSDCFTLAKSRDYVPEGQEYLIAKELKPYMKASTELQLRPRVLSNVSIEDLDIEEASAKVRQLQQGGKNRGKRSRSKRGTKRSKRSKSTRRSRSRSRSRSASRQGAKASRT